MEWSRVQRRTIKQVQCHTTKNGRARSEVLFFAVIPQCSVSQEMSLKGINVFKDSFLSIRKRKEITCE